MFLGIACMIERYHNSIHSGPGLLDAHTIRYRELSLIYGTRISLHVVVEVAMTITQIDGHLQPIRCMSIVHLRTMSASARRLFCLTATAFWSIQRRMDIGSLSTGRSSRRVGRLSSCMHCAMYCQPQLQLLRAHPSRAVLYQSSATLINCHQAYSEYQLKRRVWCVRTGLPHEWSVDLYGKLLATGGGKERMTAYFNVTPNPSVPL